MTIGSTLTAAATAVGLALAVTAVQGRQDAADGCPQVVAHRGGMGHRPENTVVGIHWAAAAGATAVELDVRWTRSKYPVLMHDPTVDRTTDGAGAVADMWLGEVTSLRAQDYPPYNADPAYNSVRVPYGWEFMQAVSSSNLDVILDIVQVPDESMMDKLVHYIDAHSWRSRTVIQANAANVALMRGWHPDLTYAVIEGYATLASMAANGQVRAGSHLRAQRAAAYTILHTGLSAPAVRYWHEHGLQVYTWTSDGPAADAEATWDTVAAAGADRLITNRAPHALAWRQTRCPA